MGIFPVLRYGVILHSGLQINDFCPEKQINFPDGFYAARSVKVHDNFLLVFF